MRAPDSKRLAVSSSSSSNIPTKKGVASSAIEERSGGKGRPSHAFITTQPPLSTVARRELVEDFRLRDSHPKPEELTANLIWHAKRLCSINTPLGRPDPAFDSLDKLKSPPQALPSHASPIINCENLADHVAHWCTETVSKLFETVNTDSSNIASLADLGFPSKEVLQKANKRGLGHMSNDGISVHQLVWRICRMDSIPLSIRVVYAPELDLSNIGFELS